MKKNSTKFFESFTNPKCILFLLKSINKSQFPIATHPDFIYTCKFIIPHNTHKKVESLLYLLANRSAQEFREILWSFNPKYSWFPCYIFNMRLYHESLYLIFILWKVPSNNLIKGMPRTLWNIYGEGSFQR